MHDTNDHEVLEECFAMYDILCALMALFFRLDLTTCPQVRVVDYIIINTRMTTVSSSELGMYMNIQVQRRELDG